MFRMPMVIRFSWWRASGHNDLVRQILYFGADTEIKNKQKQTARMLENGRPEITDMLFR